MSEEEKFNIKAVVLKEAARHRAVGWKESDTKNYIKLIS
jgi:hypothetical protein